MPVVVPGVIVDSSTTSAPRLMYRPAIFSPSISAPKSGTRSFGT